MTRGMEPLAKALNDSFYCLAIAGRPPRVVSGHVKRFEFVERQDDQDGVEEPGLGGLLQDPALSGTATAEEVEFLKRLRFKGKRPTPLYYYRELQNLRDPLHFRAP